MLLVLGTIVFAAAFMVAVDVAFRPSTDRRSSLARVVTYAQGEQQTRAPVQSRPGLIDTVVPMLSRVALRLTPKVQSDQLESRLAAAGVKRFNAQQFHALKTMLALLAVVFGFGLGGISVTGFILALLLVACALI